jgi:serine/threonine protein kinase/WD40 repeat protein
MTECPTADQLRRLLDAALPGPEQAAVEGHVDHCAACQGLLEQLTAGPQPRPKPGWVDPLASTFLARVQALSPVPGLGATGAWRDDTPVPPPDVPGYDVEGELGRGGMGVVFKARHRRLNRTVALKMLTEGGLADPGVRTRFLIEAEAVAQLRHPHVVQVYEFGEHAGRPYLAMEYVDGGNLAERLAAGRRFTPTEAAELVAATADAVAAAHAKGIIHRDLKPSNILLSAECGTRNAESKTADPSSGAFSSALRTPHSAFSPMVADFGIARVGQSHVTATGEVLGTPSYMAPEQAAGKTREVGTATDVYGLGTILYELLTGRPPFEGETAVSTLQQVVHSLPRAPRAVAPNVPRDLDTICLKCLEKSPANRYPTADALAADLRAYLDGRTIVARPARSWERAVRLTRRNPVPAAALAAIAATTLGALVWVNEARREEAAARRGEEAARRTAQDNERDALLAKNLAERGAALTAFERAVSLCEAGSVAAGLDEFARVAGLAERAGDAELVAVVRRNVAAWEDHRPREVRRFDPPDPARPVTAALFAADGRVLVTASRRGGPVRVWPVEGQLPDGKPANELAAPDPKRPGVVGLFPAPAGRVLAVYESGHVAEWEPGTGELFRSDLAFDLASPIRAAGATAVGRDKSGRLVAAGCEDGTFRLWDADRREFLIGPGDTPVFPHLFRGPKKLQRFPSGPDAPGPAPPGPVTAIDFGDVGNMLLTAGETDGVILHGMPMPKTGRVSDPIVDGRIDPRTPYHQFDLGGAVFRLLVSPDRQHFLAGGATAVSLWTIHERDRPLWTHGHPDRVTALAFSPDGRVCASADRGGTVRCWDAQSGDFRAQLNFAEPVAALCFPAATPNALLIGSDSGTSALWRLPLLAELAERPAEPRPVGPGVVIRIGSNPDQAVRAGFDPMRRGEWTATPRRLLFWPPDNAPRSAIVPQDAETLVTDAVSVSPDGKVALMVVAGRPTFSVCDRTGPKVAFKRVPAAGVSRTGFLTDRAFFTISEGAAGEFGLWELDGEKGAARRAAWPVAGVTCAAAHPDGKSVLLGAAGSERVAFRDVASGKDVGPAFRHPGATAAAVDPGGRWAATAGGVGQGVRVWPLPGDRPVDRSPLHADRVNALAFGTGPSAGVLATASSDGTARFWDAKTGHPLGPPLRHPEAVLSVAFDPAGERVITGCRNGYAKVWPAPRAAP